jgi:histidinol phosphatase-like enzyme
MASPQVAVKELAIQYTYRKPAPPMLEKVARDCRDRDRGFLIGNRDDDIVAAKAAIIRGNKFDAEIGSLLELRQL